jgi:hypothetical protein
MKQEKLCELGGIEHDTQILGAVQEDIFGEGMERTSKS